MKRSTKVQITGFLCAAALIASGVVNAQEPSKYGRLSGSFETNTIWYVPDNKTYTTSRMPEDRIGSNNYLKLDYSLGNFSAGIQGELYAPKLQGYPDQYQGGKITNKYASWTDDNFFITVGDFYDQYGSGMIFRAYEDRALGVNTSVEGFRAGMNFGDVFAITAMLGRPRLYMDYANTWLRGADATLSLSSIFGWDNHFLALEGSYLSQYDKTLTQIPDDNMKYPFSPNINAWSGRVAYEWAGLSARVELVGKSPVPITNTNGANVPHFGRGQLVELGYSGHGWGVSLTGRNIKYMEMKLSYTREGELGLGNVLNYIPSLTRQYTYNLANLDPYQVELKGEGAGQIDVFYNIRRGSSLGGRYGTKLHLNASIAYSPLYAITKEPLLATQDPNKMDFRYLDASFDFEKQWNKKFKTTILLAFQRMVGEESPILVNRYIAVFDGLYKFNSKQSLRLELQYLASPFADSKHTDSRDDGSWWAASLEYGIAPRFSFFVSDMYNFQKEQIHYYSVGMSYTKSRTRIALTYGRNRAGFVCSGGVCRQMPGYTGVNLSLTTSF